MPPVPPSSARLLALVLTLLGLAGALAPQPAAGAIPPEVGGLVQLADPAHCVTRVATTGCTTVAAGLEGPVDTVLAPDGTQLYVLSATSRTIDAFTRDPATGALAPLQSVPLGVAAASAIAVSSDGRNLYVVAGTSGSAQAGVLLVFERHTGTGALTRPTEAGTCFSPAAGDGCAPAKGLEGAEDVVVSRDGRSVYTVTNSAIGTFTRDPLTGRLTQPAGADACAGSSAPCRTAQTLGGYDEAAVSPDGATVYVTGFWGVIVLARASTTGALTPAAGYAACLQSVESPLTSLPCSKASRVHSLRALALAPDGRQVVAAAGAAGTRGEYAAEAAHVLTRAAGSGALSESSCLSTGGAGGCSAAPQLPRSVTGVVPSPDGAHVYLTESTGIVPLRRGAGGALSQTGERAPVLFVSGLLGATAMSAEGTFIHATTAGGALITYARELAPVCADVAREVKRYAPLRITLPCTDANVQDTLTRVIVAQPAHGTLTGPDADGAVTYTAEPGYTGTDTFTYRATDGRESTVVRRATLTVTGDPETEIASGPSGWIAADEATFAFSGAPDGPDTTFECRLDDGGWEPCASPRTLTGLPQGERTFAVRAVTADGGPDTSPATRTFGVDTAVPATTITSGPSGLTNGARPVFAFTADDASPAFECRLDGPDGDGAWSPCTSPHAAAPQGDGAHTFRVRATDRAGNAEAEGATRAFTLDATPPGVEGRIAYSDGTALATIAPDGTGKRVVVPGGSGSFPGDPTWSPDGTRLAYVDRSSTSDASLGLLWTVGADGTGAKRFEKGWSHGVLEPAWSPDGHRLAWEASFVSGLEVNTVLADDSAAPLDIAGEAANDQREPAWSPDGRALAFTALPRTNGTVAQIVTQRLDGTGRVTLTSAPTETYGARAPAWSPDGTRIAYLRRLGGATSTMFAIVSMAADGTDRTVHVPSVSMSAGDRVDWAPDGRRLVFSTGGEVKVLSLTTGLASTIATGRMPRWQRSSVVRIAGPDRVRATSVTLTPSADDGLTLECRFDRPAAAGSWEPCAGAQTRTGLTTGAHTLWVRASDAAGNREPVAAAGTVQVDTTPPPMPTITSPTTSTITTDEVTVAGFDNSPGGGTLVLREGTKELGRATTSPADRTFALHVTGLADGEHTLALTLTDPQGFEVTRPIRLTVDTVAPDPPRITTPARDGWSTASATTVTGTSSSYGHVIELYEGDVLLGTVEASYFGNWTLTTSALAEGPHTVRARERDFAGNWSALSAERTFTVDTIDPPDATVTVRPSSPTNAAVPVFKGTIAPEPGLRVMISDAGGKGGYRYGTVDSAGNWEVRFTDLPEGFYYLDVWTVDAAGNSASSGDRTHLSVDRTPPAAPAITAPADGERVLGTAVTLTGTAEPGVKVTVREGTGPGTTVTPSNAGAWKATVTAGHGRRTYTATAQDAAGNTSPAAVRTFDVDAYTPQAPAVTSPAELTWTRTGSVTLTGTGPAGTRIEIRDGTRLVGQGTVGGDGAWSVQATDLQEGTRALRIVAVGATGAASDPVERRVRVDRTAPQPPVTDTDGWADARTFDVAGTTEPGSTVEVRVDARTPVTTAADAEDGRWRMAVTVSTEGPHSVSFRATDPAGNVSAWSAAQTITVDTIAPVTPTLLTPSADVVSATGDVVLTGQAEPGTWVIAWDARLIPLSDRVRVGTDGAWRIELRDLDDDVYSVTVTATDDAGNESPDSIARLVTVDAPPAPPSIVLPAEQAWSRSPSVTLTGTSEPGARIEIRDGARLAGEGVASAGGAWTVAASGLADGARTLDVVAVDTTGKRSAAARRTVRVDTVAPAATILSGPATTTADRDARFTFGVTDPSATIWCQMTGPSYADLFAFPCGTGTIYEDLVNGEHRLRVWAVDEAGNEQAAPAYWTFVVTDPPAAPPEQPRTPEQPTAPAPPATPAPPPGTPQPPAGDGGVRQPPTRDGDGERNTAPRTPREALTAFGGELRTLTTTGLAKGPGMALDFTAPGPGTLQVQLVVKRGRKSVTLASGKATYGKAGDGTVRVRGTSAGKKVLKGRKPVKATVRTTFTPAGGGKSQTTIRTVTLRTR